MSTSTRASPPSIDSRRAGTGSASAAGTRSPWSASRPFRPPGSAWPASRPPGRDLAGTPRRAGLRTEHAQAAGGGILGAVTQFRSVVLIVLDSVGIGGAPDAGDFGDEGSATLQHVAEAVGGLTLPNLERLGLGCIAPIVGVEQAAAPEGVFG